MRTGWRFALVALPAALLPSLAAGACGGGEPEGRPPEERPAGEVTRETSGERASDTAPAAGEAAPSPPAADRGRDTTEVNRFLSYVSADSLAELDVWAGYGGANGAWNFDGYYEGNATIVVPLGWRVRITYQTLDANVPHSAGVVVPERPIPIDGSEVEIAFRGAASPSFVSGLPSTRPPVRFTFRADRAGRFWLFCGVPGHARNGMWIWFEVSEGISAPDFRTDGG